MENILPNSLPEIMFSSGNSSKSKQILSLVKSGVIKKLAPKIFTSNLDEEPKTIIRRNLFLILGKLYPKAVLSHRSALEFKPTESGYIFLTHSYTKKIPLPGITINFIKGPGPIDGDNPLTGDLYVSQLERALLENLQVSRKNGAQSKALKVAQIEERLEQVIRVNGEAGLNGLRDKSRVIAGKLGMQSEFEKLNKLINALLTSSPSKILSSPLAAARAFGSPYDPARLEVFEQLFVALKQKEFRDRPDQNKTVQAFKSFAFFEAYFSNYIEGTIFEIEEAKEIIESQVPLSARNEDSHDILGTYKLVSNQQEMQLTPSTSGELLEILLNRHKILLGSRFSKNPGEFKNKNNRAGETHFVDHSLVKGTLIKGFNYYRALVNPFARAAYIMFLVSEVHPFLDGNGRVARVMMNAELIMGQQSKIIIPTVYRDDYMGALRRLTRHQDTDTYIRMLERTHAFSETIVGDDLDVIEKMLQEANAFKEGDEAKLKFVE